MSERLPTTVIVRRLDSPYLFGGQEPERTDLMSKRFGRVARRAKVTFTPRMLRHFHASQLIAAGVDVKTVADRLGHSNPQTTWMYYVGSVPVTQTVAAETIAKVLPCRKAAR